MWRHGTIKKKVGGIQNYQRGGTLDDGTFFYVESTHERNQQGNSHMLCIIPLVSFFKSFYSTTRMGRRREYRYYCGRMKEKVKLLPRGKRKTTKKMCILQTTHYYYFHRGRRYFVLQAKGVKANTWHSLQNRRRQRQ